MATRRFPPTSLGNVTPSPSANVRVWPSTSTVSDDRLAALTPRMRTVCRYDPRSPAGLAPHARTRLSMYPAASPEPLVNNARPSSSSDAMYDSHSLRSSLVMVRSPPPGPAPSVTAAVRIAVRQTRTPADRRIIRPPPPTLDRSTIARPRGARSVNLELPPFDGVRPVVPGGSCEAWSQLPTRRPARTRSGDLAL